MLCRDKDEVRQKAKELGLVERRQKMVTQQPGALFANEKPRTRAGQLDPFIFRVR
jgi:hypothetical protein